MGSTFVNDIDFYGYIFATPLGFVGHACSLITFLSKTLRITSVGFLFICLTISDVLYLSMSTYEFLQDVDVPVLRSEHVCRFYTFILNFSTFTSAWLLVLIAIDRLVRVRFPFRQGRLCTRKVAAIMATFICICATVYTHHVLQPEFAFTSRTGNRCGPLRSPPTTYSIFYTNVWPIIQLVFTYILPSVSIIFSVIGIYSKMRVRQNAVVASMRREKQQRQMLILMISSVTWFIVCTLPFGLFRIVTQRTESTSVIRVIDDVLDVLRNMNYCFNFYIHCLTSELFRKTFIEQLKRIAMRFNIRIGQDNNAIHPLQTLVRPQTLRMTN